MKEQVEAKTLKEGRYVLIDEEPCKILSIDVSKPGKHGAAKMRVEATGVFTSSRRSMITSMDEKVYVPLMDRRRAQVLSVHGGVAQLMDMENYQTFEMPIPQEFQAAVEAGKEIEYLEAMGKRMITRV